MANRPLALLMLLVLAGPVLAGCFGDDTDTDPDPSPTASASSPGPSPTTDPADWTNPYPFPLHFDGAAAYDTALRQLYDDPDAKTGPRYRIPGTPDHATVATLLTEALRQPVEDLGGTVTQQRFDGATYYALDLAPVSNYLCDTNDPARDRVRDLEFVNIVGRTSSTQVGLIIGAHWDSKRHADPNRDPDHAGEPILAADDGAAGTAAVIELARAFAADEPGIPLTFILFDGEDGFEEDDCHPLAGSLYYAQGLDAVERETVAGMVLLDMVGNTSASFLREGNSRSYSGGAGRIDSSWLGDLVWSTAAAMQVEAFRDRTTASIADDHVPFLHEGFYALDIIRYENGFAPYWHTTRDDETVIQPAGIEQVGVVVEASIRRYADDPDAFRP